MNAQEITFFTPSTVRVVKNAPDMSKEMGLSLVVTAKPEAVKVTKKTDGNTTTYTSSMLSVRVDNASHRVTFTDKKGNINYVKGANIAGFMRVADAMLAQGII